MFYALVIALVGGSFVAGKIYGAKVEADAIALGLKIKSAVTTDVGNAYKTVVADIKATETAVLARLKSIL